MTSEVVSSAKEVKFADTSSLHEVLLKVCQQERS